MIFHRYPTIDMDVGPSLIVPITYARSMLEDRLSLELVLKARMEGGLDHDLVFKILKHSPHKQGKG